MGKEPEPGTRRLAITFIVDTTNQSLWPDRIIVRDSADAEALHAAVLAEAPHMRRVISVMDEADCRALHMSNIIADVLEHLCSRSASAGDDEIAPHDRRH